MRRSQAPSVRRAAAEGAAGSPLSGSGLSPAVPRTAPTASFRAPLHAIKPPQVVEPTTTTDGAKEVARYFSVVWCKAAAANRKHIKWEGDAVLIAAGARVTLKDMDGKDIGTTTAYSASTLATLSDGDTLLVGGKHIEVMGKIAAEAYESGKCFLSNGGKRAGSVAVAPAASVKESVLAPPAKRARVDQVLPGVAAEAPATAGALQPRHDPRAPNALVLPRPSAAHARTHGQGRPIVDVVVDPKLSNVLRPHQREGVTFLYECTLGLRDFDGFGAILADEMGLGKTLQTITLVWTLLKQGPYGKQPVARRALVVCPATLVKNWQNEFKRWLGDERVRTFALDYDSPDVGKFINSTIYSVLIVGYEKFRNVTKELRNAKIDIAIFDEGHKLKNANVKISQAIRELPTRRRVLLTGTPIQNDLGEFFAMVDVINPGVLGTYAMFKKVFEDPIVAARQKNSTPEEVQLGDSRSAELTRLTGMFILRRTHEINKKYLPAKTEVILFCPASQLQRQLYRAVIGSQVFRLATGTAGSPTMHLFCLTLLRKLCNSLALLQDGATAAVDGDDEDAAVAPPASTSGVEASAYQALRGELAARLTGAPAHEHSGKLTALRELLRLVRSTTKEKVVLVSSYTQTLDVFETLCAEESFSFLRLDGATPTSKRQAIVDRFNSKHFDDFVLLLSARAGGVGLNLVGASRIVLYDINWNPAVDLQAMARIWREGQTRPVVIYRFLTTGTIEEKVYQRQLAKLALSDAVIDDKQGTKMAFSKEDLKDLFTYQDDVECLTHDLMDCTCLGASKGVTSVAARSQQRAEEVAASLQELREWQHINSTNVDNVSVEDPLLRHLVKAGHASFVFHRHAKSPADMQAEEATRLAAGIQPAPAEESPSACDDATGTDMLEIAEHGGDGDPMDIVRE